MDIFSLDKPLGMYPQEVRDALREHCASGGRVEAWGGWGWRSVSGRGTSCVYLAPNGNKCAVGHLFSKEELYEVGDFIGIGDVYSLDSEWVSRTDLPKPDWLDDLDFLVDIQGIHDGLMDLERGEFICNFKTGMAEVAVRYGLTVPELEQE